MKQQVTLALSLTLAAGLLAGCADTTGGSQPTGAAQTSPADATPSAAQSAAFTDEMKIPHAVDLSPEDGADSVERLGDHADSPYFAHPDYYHMQSSDTLTILTGFQTMQQTSEWACGVTSTLMVLNWYDRLGDWNEESLAALRHSLEGTGLAGYPGTTLRQAMDIFGGVGGFTYTTNLDYEDPSSEVWMDTIQTSEEGSIQTSEEGSSEVWMDTIQGWLAEGKPVMVCWNDWGGHWQVIIGYDTMGTETQQDDVFIVADPYDTTDHCQDGYGVLMAERFLYNFSMYGAFPEEEGGSDFLFLVASPAE